MRSMVIIMKPKGLYIHVPFCVKKCPYCDFYSETDLSLTDAYTDAVIRNIEQRDIYADTIYFGGGTPSLLTPAQIEKILSHVKIAEDAEVTVECNPNTVNPEYLRGIFASGVNRISFGIQSLDDGELKMLGRIHDSQTAVNAVNLAYNAGFRNISADLMLCTANQTMRSLENTIEKLVKLPITHVSAYLLKIEPDTPYGRNDSIYSLLPDEDETADMYLFTVKKLAEHSFEQYEISNFAKDGFQSRHNLKYWLCEEYYGIGPSAHSYIDGVRRACPKNLRQFISDDTQTEYVTEENGGDYEEQTMLNLRLTKVGTDIEIADNSAEILKRAKPLIEAGLMKLDGSRLTLTPEGCLVSNEIICRLL